MVRWRLLRDCGLRDRENDKTLLMRNWWNCPITYGPFWYGLYRVRIGAIEKNSCCCNSSRMSVFGGGFDWRVAGSVCGGGEDDVEDTRRRHRANERVSV